MTRRLLFTSAGLIAAGLGARLNLFSKPGAGTVIRLDVPTTARWTRP